MRILVVEDDKLIASALTEILSSQSYAVEVATDGQAGLALVEAFEYDLILLDVMLPKLDGISFCRQVRSQGYSMPILLLTGRESHHDRAVGLDAGADDYLVKPFDVEELVARIRALLRRASSTSQPVLGWGDLQLDPSLREVTYAGKSLSLTPKEYALLELFLRNSHRVFSCGAILEHLWTYEDAPGEEAVRTHIKGLRQRLKSGGAPADFVETVYGIGYRLKPLHAEPKSTAKNSEIAKANEPFQQQALINLDNVWSRFKEQVSEQITVLEQAALPNPLSQELQQQAKQEAHSLAGSLGTFGLSEGSQLARNIEHLLKTDKILDSQRMQFREWVSALRQTIEHPSETETISPSPALDERPLLLVVDHDRQLAAALVNEAEGWGFQGVIASSLYMAQDKLYRHNPSVVLLDPSFSSTLEDSLTLLRDLDSRKPPVPAIVLSSQTGLIERVKLTRQGGKTFLQKPVPVAQVLEAVAHLAQQAIPETATVLAVDDDPKILAMLQTLLTPWGLKVVTLNDPRKFWEMLEVYSPDLLVLDIEMPYLSGIDLCQVVRSDARWGGLPVLFLTAHTESTVVNQVFAVGADDFVSKPIVGPELVTRIVNRLERIRLLRHMAETDPLTKVANRHKSTQDLEEFLRLAKRQNQSLCLAILDVDYFKQVNDRYGHTMGDAVLRQIGGLLLQFFRSEDVVARWGGDEFIIGLYGATLDDATQRLTRLLNALRQRDFMALDPSIKITGTAGIAQYPKDGADLQSLYRAADTALYRAKQAGRDRVFSTDATPELSFVEG
ncbi:response regulator [Phormidium tenue FACHB-886]|nr:response regulator [Phormidium tenue FACHB-886]